MFRSRYTDTWPFIISVAAIALSAAMLSAITPPAWAAPPTVSFSTSDISEAPDYASENWQDPWDYGNAEDFNITPDVQSGHISNIAMAGGNLAFDTEPGGWIVAQPGGQPFPYGRDGDIHPIDADRYTHIRFRMWSGASSTVAGGIFWFTCANGSPGCFNAMSFALQPGWNVYDLQLQPNLTGSPWEIGRAHV